MGPSNSHNRERDVLSKLILDRPIGRALLQVAKAEGLIASDDPFGPSGTRTRYQRLIKRCVTPIREPVPASGISLECRYEIEVPVRTSLLRFDQGGDAEYTQRCDDMSLLIGYCRAVDPSLTMPRIAILPMLLRDARRGESLCSAVCGSRRKGSARLLADAIQRALTKIDTVYSEEQLAAYGRYSAARADADTILTCISDIDNVWHLRTDNNPVSFHPRLARDYNDILAQDPAGDEEITDTDLFFLTVRALRTLPVGRTLTETLNLGATKEGVALRARVAELHGQMKAGATNLDSLIGRIENDADQYRSLTARLQSPHFLSKYIDMVLSGLGLVPFVGTYASALSLAKSSWATRSTHNTRAQLKTLSWAAYQGRAI